MGLKGTTEHSLDRIIQSRSPLQSNPIHKNKTKVIRVDLMDFDFDDIFRFWDISLLITFNF